MEGLQALGGVFLFEYVYDILWLFMFSELCCRGILLVTSCDRFTKLILYPCLKMSEVCSAQVWTSSICWVSELDGCFMRVCDSNWFVSFSVGWLNHKPF
jgi:hypothetical protein